jgi:Protein phosphatase 2C
VWVLGGIGDGLAAIRMGGRDLDYVIGGPRSGFLNETVGLGLSRSAKDWRFATYLETPDLTAAVVATDGISDDLVPERTETFTAWLVKELEGLSPRQRTHRLRTMLRRWPSPKHSDDKTLGIIWESAIQGHDE